MKWLTRLLCVLSLVCAVALVGGGQRAGAFEFNSNAAGGSANIDDTVYGVGWDADTTDGASKNALYDKIELLATTSTTTIDSVFDTGDGALGDITVGKPWCFEANSAAETLCLQWEAVDKWAWITSTDQLWRVDIPNTLTAEFRDSAGTTTLLKIDETTGNISGQPQSETFTIVEPDTVQGVADIVVLKHFDTETYPDGVTITDILIATSETCTDTVAILERSNNGTAWATDATTESITLSGTRTEDDGTLTDATYDADDYAAIDLDGTSPCDIESMIVTLRWTVTP